MGAVSLALWGKKGHYFGIDCGNGRTGRTLWHSGGLPKFWNVFSTTGEEPRRYPGTAKAVAVTRVTEFNVTAFEIHARLRVRPNLCPMPSQKWSSRA